MKVSAITLGCKVNQYETQAMLSQLHTAGFLLCEKPEESDVVIINSCTVTAASDHKVRQILRRVRKKAPSAVIVLTGCMPQAFPEQSDRWMEADVVMGNSNRSFLLDHILAFISSRQRIVDIVPHETGETFEQMCVTDFYERTRAFVKIEDGCNRFCSYCIIPYARGRVRSKPLEELGRELAELGRRGYREVVLTGINLSAYGQDIGKNLCDAVEVACSVPEIQRVRLGSLEPEQMDENTIARLAVQNKLCPQFHLSLQSGCDATLRRMNRHYDTAEYRAIVHRLRNSFSNVSITTDVMVGFPGETEEEFAQSLAFVKEIGFAKTHVFAYSRRPGTRADREQGQVTNAVKEKRSRKMIAATLKTQADFLAGQCGKTESVIFEQLDSTGMWGGYTPNYTFIRVKSSRPLAGEVADVFITKAEEEYCLGNLVCN